MSNDNRGSILNVNERPWIVGLFVAVFVLWAVSGLLILWFIPDWAHRGLAGDMFGAVNALFSGLALAGVIVAIYLQGRELQLQRLEFRQQKFENTFFHLLRLHNEMLHTSRAEPDGGATPLSGRLAFQEGVERFVKEYAAAGAEPFSDDEALLRINQIYTRSCQSRSVDFGHYFRNLYHVIKFVDESDIDDKPRYAKILRAQLSNDELTLLFFNGLRRAGRSKFKILIERHALLHDMRESELVQKYRRFYAERAFSDSAE